MTFLGVSVILILGIVNLILILFQMGTGLRLMKVPLSFHRRGAFALLLSSLAHATLAFLAH
ncbi:MAG: hypothetical protein ACUVXD_03350 [Thermodesulfobacteriota bacterium]